MCGLSASHTCKVVVSVAYLCVMSVVPLPEGTGTGNLLDRSTGLDKTIIKFLKIKMKKNKDE